MQVIVDPEELAARQLTIDDVRMALRGQNADTSGGDFWEGKRRYVVRTLGQFRSPEQVEAVILARRDDAPVYVRDVAEVELGYKKPDGMVRRYGTGVIAVNALRETGANVLDVMDGLRRARAELNEGILKSRDLELTQVYDETEYIYSAIGLVQTNIVVGGLLTVAVLLLFLRSGRSTLVIGLAIPTSIIGTFLVLSLLGRSLNVISLAGMAFAVGMLVDNAVVVLENIYQHYQKGEGVFRAVGPGHEGGLGRRPVVDVDDPGGLPAGPVHPGGGRAALPRHRAGDQRGGRPLADRLDHGDPDGGGLDPQGARRRRGGRRRRARQRQRQRQGVERPCRQRAIPVRGPARADRPGGGRAGPLGRAPAARRDGPRLRPGRHRAGRLAPAGGPAAARRGRPDGRRLGRRQLPDDAEGGVPALGQPEPRDGHPAAAAGVQPRRAGADGRADPGVAAALLGRRGGQPRGRGARLPGDRRLLLRRPGPADLHGRPLRRPAAGRRAGAADPLAERRHPGDRAGRQAVEPLRAGADGRPDRRGRGRRARAREAGLDRRPGPRQGHAADPRRPGPPGAEPRPLEPRGPRDPQVGAGRRPDGQRHDPRLHGRRPGRRRLRLGLLPGRRQDRPDDHRPGAVRRPDPGPAIAGDRHPRRPARPAGRGGRHRAGQRPRADQPPRAPAGDHHRGHPAARDAAAGGDGPDPRRDRRAARGVGRADRPLPDQPGRDRRQAPGDLELA